ncbi:hypothetical protein AB5J72_02730 [Streptomyces sp. CG1]|uniref:hypothetical protein n=1 Tax=Streptomyces sp. CG1 TaxID=1287523 RepID=UPI0034E1965A
MLSAYLGLGSVIGTQSDTDNEPSIGLPGEYDWVGEPYRTRPASTRSCRERPTWPSSPRAGRR